MPGLFRVVRCCSALAMACLNSPMDIRLALQVVDCLQQYTQSLPFQCVRYNTSSHASEPVDFSDMPECSWQQLQPPQWSHHTYPSAVPGLTAAVAAACDGQPLDQQATLQELGKIFSTCSTGTGCNSSVQGPQMV